MKIVASVLADFYKMVHIFMYPKDTTLIYTNNCPRSGHHFPVPGVEKILFVGLQGIIQWLLIDTWNKNFFNRPEEEVINEYLAIMDKALGQGAVTADHLRALHRVGYLPLKIKALPEGSLVPFKVPTFTIRNTKPEFFWLVNYFEDMLSCENWPVMTVATLSYYFRQMLEKFAEETGGDKSFVHWQGHCFAFRGMRGIHDATQSLTGHMYSFLGTDTIPVIPYLEEYYDGKNTFIGGSVPASEHSVMCMLIAEEMATTPSTGDYHKDWLEAERKVFKKLITETYPSGIISIVSDTKNLWDVLTDIAPSLKPEILARPVNELGLSKVVFRPDSGDPTKIICGYKIFHKDWKDIEEKHISRIIEGGYEVIIKEGKYFIITAISEEDESFIKIEKEITKPEALGAVRCLWEHFGGTTDKAGYKVLNERVGLIYGDSITFARAEAILQHLKEMGFASTNVVFGRGSYGSVYNTRDTTGSAMKATYGEVNGQPRELFKDPITDSGSKRSAKGLLRVEEENGTFVLYDQQTWEQEASGALQTVFEDGIVYNFQTLAEIRNRVGFIKS